METRLIEAPASGEMRDYKMLVGGEWVDALSGKTFESINPYTGRAWATAPEADEKDVDRAVNAARAAFDEGPWGKMTGTERARLMRRLADLLAENAEELATVESTDNGKLLREMGGQLGALPEWYYYFAGAADKIQGETIPSDKPNFFVYTRREPIGVVGAIVPWNSPLLLLTFKLAPALAAGCTIVVKPAEQTPASVLEFAKLFEEAGFPPGVVNVVTGYGEETGRPLVRHPGVDKVAFTGSTETGISVMKDAADHLARVSLELGGKSPNIVFDDADLEATNNGVVSGIFAATGQTCIAPAQGSSSTSVPTTSWWSGSRRRRGRSSSATRWRRRPRWAPSPSRSNSTRCRATSRWEGRKAPSLSAAGSGLARRISRTAIS